MRHFLAILFWNQPKGMDLKVWEGGGGGSKGPARQPSSTSPRRFSSMRNVDRLKEGF